VEPTSHSEGFKSELRKTEPITTEDEKLEQSLTLPQTVLTEEITKDSSAHLDSKPEIILKSERIQDPPREVALQTKEEPKVVINSSESKEESEEAEM